MFSLAYPIDDVVEIDGQTYELDMSFDNVIRLIDMLNDNELDDITKVETGLYMLLGVELDYDLEKKAELFRTIFEQAIAQGKKAEPAVDIAGDPMPEKKEEEVYSLKQDAEYIYASFMQDYGIDLIEQQGKLHWYKFKALLGGLRSDTQFKEIINIRTMELPSGKGMEKERRRIKKLKEAYKLKKE